MSQPVQRLFHVDAARTIAVGLVTGFHVWRHFGSQKYMVGDVNILAPLARGFVGVDLFFVISGYAMMLTWERSREIPFNQRVVTFYKSRLARIYPPYVVAVAFWCAFSILSVSRHPDAKDIYAHLAMLHTFDRSTFFSISGVLWSIAVETHFYIVFPLLVMASFRATSIIVVGAFASTALMCWMVTYHAWHAAVATWNVVCFLPLFVLGMALYRTSGQIPLIIPLLAALCAVVLLTAEFKYPAIFGVSTAFAGRLLTGACLGVAILAGLTEKAPRYAMPVTMIATASYSIYLYNYIFLFTPKPVLSGFIGAAIYVLGVVTFGSVMWALVERPVEAFRGRLRANRHGLSPAAM